MSQVRTPIRPRTRCGVRTPLTGSGGGNRLPTAGLLFRCGPDGVDTIGLSIADYAKVDPAIRGAIFSDPSTKYADATIFANLLAHPLINKSWVVGKAGIGVAIYDYLTTPASVLEKACKYYKSVYSGWGLPLWYVDSVNGSDAYNGLTIATAFATLAKVLSVVQAGQGIGLVCGSNWMETCNIPHDNVFIKTVGVGSAPIIDGAAIVESSEWVNDGTYTNTYKITRTSLGSVSDSNQSIWEDGQILVLAASASACDTTAGTFYYASTNAGLSYTIYMHPTTGVPISNGRAYRESARLFGVNVEVGVDDVAIIGPLVVKRSQHHDGVLRLAGKNCRAYNVDTSSGAIHSVYISTGYLYNVTSDGCPLYGSTDFVCNAYPSEADSEVFMENCRVTGKSGTYGTAFFNHANTLKRIKYKNCDAATIATGFGFSGGTGTIQILDGCMANCGDSAVAVDDQFGTAGSETYLINSILTSRAGNRAIKISGGDGVSPTIVFSYGSYIDSFYAIGIINSNNTELHVYQSNLTGNDLCVAYTGALSPGKINIFNSIFHDVDYGYYAPVAGSVFSGDKNLYSVASRVASDWLGTIYASLASWQTVTSEDDNSLSGSPNFVSNPANETNFTLLNFATNTGSPAKTLSAGIADKPSTFTAPIWVDTEVAALINY